jgi:hypothetical protein
MIVNYLYARWVFWLYGWCPIHIKPKTPDCMGCHAEKCQRDGDKAARRLDKARRILG